MMKLKIFKNLAIYIVLLFGAIITITPFLYMCLKISNISGLKKGSPSPKILILLPPMILNWSIMEKISSRVNPLGVGCL